MYTYAFLSEHGLTPEGVEDVLRGLGVAHKGVQVFHYTRPRIVMVMTEVELEPQMVDNVREAIAGIRGEDPPVPNV